MQKFASLLLCTALCSAPAALSAQDAASVVNAGILSGWRMENGHHMAALRLDLEDGWKTYWRAPGDAGIPPSFDWSGSGNVAAVAVHWPVPHVFGQNGLRSLGYSGAVVMPLEITPARAGEDISLSGRVEIGICQDICIPVALDLNAALSGSAADADPAIRAALADRPMTAAEAGVASVTCTVEPISDGLRLTVSMDVPRMAPTETTVVEFADPTVWISETETRRDGAHLTAVADLVPADSTPFALSRDHLRFTVLGEGRAVDIRGCAAG